MSAHVAQAALCLVSRLSPLRPDEKSGARREPWPWNHHCSLVHVSNLKNNVCTRSDVVGGGVWHVTSMASCDLELNEFAHGGQGIGHRVRRTMTLYYKIVCRQRSRHFGVLKNDVESE